MSFESGKCYYCGNKKAEHVTVDIESDLYVCVCEDGQHEFTDSGLNRVRDNSVQLLEAAKAYRDFDYANCEVRPMYAAEYFDKLKALDAAISNCI